MRHRLRYDRRFLQQIAALPGDVRAVARQLVKDLSEDPRPADAKELDGHPGHYRLWLPRNHRLVWQVHDGIPEGDRPAAGQEARHEGAADALLLQPGRPRGGVRTVLLKMMQTVLKDYDPVTYARLGPRLAVH